MSRATGGRAVAHAFKAAAAHRGCPDAAVWRIREPGVGSSRRHLNEEEYVARLLETFGAKEGDARALATLAQSFSIGCSGMGVQGAAQPVACGGEWVHGDRVSAV